MYISSLSGMWKIHWREQKKATEDTGDFVNNQVRKRKIQVGDLGRYSMRRERVAFGDHCRWGNWGRDRNKQWFEVAWFQKCRVERKHGGVRYLGEIHKEVSKTWEKGAEWKLKIESIHLQIIFKSMVTRNTMQRQVPGGAKAGKYEKAKWKMGMRQRGTGRGVALEAERPQGVTLLWSREHWINV